MFPFPFHRHIPKAFTANEGEVTLASPPHTTTTPASPSQHTNDDSLRLSLDTTDDEHSTTCSESVQSSVEASEQGASPLTLTNSSCHSSLGNFADDERSICSTRLSNVSSPLSPIPSGTVHWHQADYVTSPPHQSSASPNNPTSKSTLTLLHLHSPTSALPQENGQQENFSSHHSDQSSLQKPAPVTEIPPAHNHPKTSAVCPKKLCDTFMELSVKCVEPDCHPTESNCISKHPDFSPTEPDCSPKMLSNNHNDPPYSPRRPLKSYIESDCNLTEPNCSESSNILRQPDSKDNESPSIPKVLGDSVSDSPNIPIESDSTISESCNTHKGHHITVTESPHIHKASDDTVNGSPNITIETNDTVNRSPNITIETDDTVNGSPNITIETDDKVNGSPNITIETDDTANGSPNITIETDDTANGSPNITIETDDTANGSPNITIETDDTVNGSPNITIETDDTVNGSPNITIETDDTVSESHNIHKKPHNIISEPSNISMETDDILVESSIFCMEPDATVSECSIIPIEPGCSLSESLSDHRNSNCIVKLPISPRKLDDRVNEPVNCPCESVYSHRGSPNSHKKNDSNLKELDCSLRESTYGFRGNKCSPTDPDCSPRVLEHNFREPDSNPKEAIISLVHLNSSCTELHNSLNHLDASPKEPLNKELDDNPTKPFNIIRKLDDSSMEVNCMTSFSASPRFNDTLEEIELFMKYGVNYGEEGTSPVGGCQQHITSPIHTLKGSECNLHLPCTPKERPSSARKPSTEPLVSAANIPKESNLSELDCKVNEPNNSLLGDDVDGRECVSIDGEPHCYPMEPHTSVEKLDDNHGQFNASTSFTVSPKFNDTLEDVEQFLKYGMNYGEDTFPSRGSEECITSPHNTLHPPLDSGQASAASPDVVNVEAKKSCGAALRVKEHTGLPSQVVRTPVCPPSKALHTSNVHSLPSLATSITKLGLTRPIQRVTPTSRAPLSLPRPQPAREGRATPMKTTPTVKLIKASPTSHTPITSRLHQPQTTRVRLHLGSPAVIPTPKATGLPPHPQKKAAVKNFVPKKTPASTPDGNHGRMLWHKSVASPLAKELRNNPPPPLITNVKPSSSCSPRRWHTTSSHASQPSPQLPYKAHKVTAQGISTPQVNTHHRTPLVIPSLRMNNIILC